MPAVNDLSISTQTALEENIESLTIDPPKRKRGRPPKVKPIIPDPIMEDDEDDEIVCPKCGVDDPGDWSQCKGCCPMPESPCYNATWIQEQNKSPFPDDGIPDDTFGNWKTFSVSETSQVFVKWFNEIEKIVEEGWTLKIKSRKKFIGIYRSNGHQTKVFAFVRKNTGNIHTPMTHKDPFIHFVGNILNPDTRLSVITPYGVKSHWEWLPTHEKYNETLAKSIMGEYDTDKNDDDLEDDDDGE